MSNLHFFNPGCELEVASGLPNYSLQKYPAMLERDLSVLPMFLSKPGDYIVSESADPIYKEYWNEHFPCTFVRFSSPALRRQELGKYCPWGLSPRVLALAKDLRFSSDYLMSPVSVFTENHKMLFSRATESQFFRSLIDAAGCYPANFTPECHMPFIARSIGEAEEFFCRAAQSSFHGSVLKAVFGSSGRGVRILRDCRFTPNIRSWVMSVLQQQGSIACEYLFDKLADFSMHYEILGGKARFMGLSQFSTSESGAYKSSAVRRFHEIPMMPGVAVERLSSIHIKALEKSIYCSHYEGALGIDCIIYRHEGSLMLNPCIEINCRNSMGRLAMELSSLVSETSMAEYHVYQKDRPLPGMEQKPVFSNGKLVSGFLPLSPSDTRMFAAGILAR